MPACPCPSAPGPPGCPAGAGRRRLLLLALLWPAACAPGPPPGLGVAQWDPDRFAGTWFEIARLDNSAQQGQEQASLAVARRPDGMFSVVWRGLESRAGRWTQHEATARPLSDPATASLVLAFADGTRVTWHVIRLAEDYSILLAAGAGRDRLWLLARTPGLPPAVEADWLAFARAHGFATGRMVRNQPSP